METSPQAGAESPSALDLDQRQHSGSNQQPEGQATNEHGHQGAVHVSGVPRLLIATSFSLVAVVQLLWVALIVYGAYWAAALLVGW